MKREDIVSIMLNASAAKELDSAMESLERVIKLEAELTNATNDMMCALRNFVSAGVVAVEIGGKSHAATETAAADVGGSEKETLRVSEEGVIGCYGTPHEHGGDPKNHTGRRLGGGHGAPLSQAKGPVRIAIICADCGFENDAITGLVRCWSCGNRIIHKDDCSRIRLIKAGIKSYASDCTC